MGGAWGSCTPNSVFGGGGKGGSSSCSTDWSCSWWSFCDVNLKQKRVCSLENSSCFAKESKPTEIKDCSDILFDSAVEIKTHRVFPWNSLKFDVTLLEMNNSEKVDVEVVYTIYSGKNVIYEEKETRAVDGNLSFTKKIDGLDLSPGKYSLVVKVNYGKNQSAGAENSFSVVGISSFLFFFFGLILLAVLGFIGYNWNKTRKEEMEIEESLKHIEEKLNRKKDQKQFGGLKKVETSVINNAERKIYGSLRKIVPEKKPEKKGLDKDKLDEILDGMNEKEYKDDGDKILDDLNK